MFVQDAIPGIEPDELLDALKIIYFFNEEGFEAVKKIRKDFENKKSQEILDFIEAQRNQAQKEAQQFSIFGFKLG